MIALMRHVSHGLLQAVMVSQNLEQASKQQVMAQCIFDRCMIHACERTFHYCCWTQDLQCYLRLKASNYFMLELKEANICECNKNQTE